MRGFIALGVLVYVCFIHAAAVIAVQMQYISGPGGDTQFGYALSSCTDQYDYSRLLVSGPYSPGGAYIYQREPQATDWGSQKSLPNQPSSCSNSMTVNSMAKLSLGLARNHTRSIKPQVSVDLFGRSVALASGCRFAVVGAVSDFGGSVQIYNLLEPSARWFCDMSITAPNAGEFGSGAGMDATGAVVAVGASSAGNSGNGRVFMFWSDGGDLPYWFANGTIEAPASASQCGQRVHMCGNASDALTLRVVMGCDNGVYVYKYASGYWVHESALSLPSANTRGFGLAVGVAGASCDWIAVSSSTPKKAYVYKRHGTSWTQTAEATGDANTGDSFGSAVSISSDGSLLVVGANTAPNGESGVGPGITFLYACADTGSVTVCDKISEITPDETSPVGFGSATTMAPNSTLLIGASLEDGQDGGVYVEMGCGPGEYPSGGGSQLACTACQQGRYATQGWASVCTSCALGRFGNVTGASSSSSCEACAPGTYGNVMGASVCALCPPGKFSPDAGSQTSSNCTGTCNAACASGHCSGPARAQCTSISPTAAPTPSPSHAPTKQPTATPSATPTSAPTATPSASPTPAPTPAPTTTPTTTPTLAPTVSPGAPSHAPTATPTLQPTFQPTLGPTRIPTPSPTVQPSPSPSPNSTPTPTPAAHPASVLDKYGSTMGYSIMFALLGLVATAVAYLLRKQCWKHTHKCITDREQYLRRGWRPNIFQACCLLVWEPNERRLQRTVLMSPTDPLLDDDQLIAGMLDSEDNNNNDRPLLLPEEGPSTGLYAELPDTADR